MGSLRKVEKLQTRLEEFFNAFSHGLGVLFGIIAFILLSTYAIQTGNIKIIISCMVYGSTLILMYLSSVLYHSTTTSKIKRVFKSLDHACIYLLIAGSYTPFVLVSIGGIWGWTLFTIVWSIAIFGVIFKCFFAHRFKILSVILYLIMGWLVLIAIKPILLHVPVGAIILLLIGGLAYTFGTIFYALDGRYYFFHLLWHLFVLMGSLFQFFAIMIYVA